MSGSYRIPGGYGRYTVPQPSVATHRDQRPSLDFALGANASRRNPSTSFLSEFSFSGQTQAILTRTTQTPSSSSNSKTRLDIAHLRSLISSESFRGLHDALELASHILSLNERCDIPSMTVQELSKLKTALGDLQEPLQWLLANFERVIPTLSPPCVPVYKSIKSSLADARDASRGTLDKLNASLNPLHKYESTPV